MPVGVSKRTSATGPFCFPLLVLFPARTAAGRRGIGRGSCRSAPHGLGACVIGCPIRALSSWSTILSTSDVEISPIPKQRAFPLFLLSPSSSSTSSDVEISPRPPPPKFCPIPNMPCKWFDVGFSKCVCVCARACVRACVRARMCACVCACVCVAPQVLSFRPAVEFRVRGQGWAGGQTVWIWICLDICNCSEADPT